MHIIVSIFRYTAIVIFSIVLCSVLSPWISAVYKSIFPNDGGGFDISFSGVVAFFYSVEILIIGLTFLLGDKYRYWIGGIIAIGILAFEYFGDPFNFYLPVLLVGSGLTIGLAIRSLISQTIGK